MKFNADKRTKGFISSKKKFFASVYPKRGKAQNESGKMALLRVYIWTINIVVISNLE